ncbi:FMN-binding negative transcriptional regulator [Agrobacterium vitis]|nr:FMN-binding negative transcriptional regulator [Agrobacterium vitis]MCM2453266.1 FMN-binding negative transcriptional regulator [Agrobacterium vitis]MCM2471692.1 FMN-binding negative transcriptional regulator [Agrobacterium vitis]MUO73348.1 hypothetical protein [Agrobacterium vitis]MUO87427.1 hypothetical protein [Agrobacterium vitis]MVA35912.1 hypothetical protein [Agrobacterium vitis]
MRQRRFTSLPFRQNETDALFGFIERNPFALPITAGAGSLITNPCPCF